MYIFLPAGCTVCSTETYCSPFHKPLVPCALNNTEMNSHV